MRGALTAGDPQVMQTWQQLSTLSAQHMRPDGTAAGLSQLSQLVWREADIMTSNQTFQLMAMIFLGSLLIMPLVKKVVMSAGGGGH